MRVLVLILVASSMAASLVFVERRQVESRVGFGAVMRVIADFQREAERIPLGLTRVSDEEERSVGEKIAANYGFTHRSRGLNEEERAIERYLNVVGSRVAAKVSRRAISYQFHLETSPGFVNAFALPGGHIVVGRGLLQLMNSEDELAAVLGHEVAHVDRRHCIERLQYELAVRKLGLRVPYALASIPIELFKAGYNKELELEADRVGVGLAVEAGYSPQGAIDLFKRFQKLKEEAEKNPSSPARELTGVLLSGLTEYLRSHPPAPERVAEVEKEIVSHNWKRTPVRPLQML